MTLSRRGFFGVVAAAFASTRPVLEWCAKTTTPFQPLNAVIGDGTIGGIDRATFSFWRNQGLLRHDDPPYDLSVDSVHVMAKKWRQIYEECRSQKYDKLVN
ncbi:MAG: hypothetical protein ACREJC_10820 [Tepidisphaeraceae bacterium]